MALKWILVSAAALAAAAPHGEAAAQAGRSYPIRAFDSITAAGPNNVIVSVGPAVSVRAEGSAEVLDKMEVVVEDGELEIRPRREFRNNYRWRDHAKATFYVTAPSLKEATIAGSGDMKINRIQGDKFSAAIAGSGNLDVASLRVSQARLSIAGSGDLSARGSAGEAHLSIAGSGNIHASNVVARTASISIAGSGNAGINATDTANVSIIGSGDVAVTGTARCTVSKMGSGKVACGR